MLHNINLKARPTLHCLRYGTDRDAEVQEALLLAKKEEETSAAMAEALEPWHEPDTIEALLDAYIVESKFSGRTAGTTLFCVQSKRRDGTLDQVPPSQKFKLFLAPWPNRLQTT